MSDKVFLRYDSEKISGVTKHEKGFLTAWGTMSRVGVQNYFNKDGTITKELRLPEEVFDQKSLDSFNNIPVTDDHPKVIITVDNAKDFQRGLTGDKTQKKNDSYTINKMTFTDSALIEKIDKGKVELSLGYECKLEEKPGVHPLYGAFDSIQREIRGNHIAVVDNARAGSEARLHLDGYDNVAIIINKEENNMKKIKIDGNELEVSEEVHDAIVNTALKEKKVLDDSNAKIVDANKKIAELTAENEKMKEKDKKDSEDSELVKVKADFKVLEDSIPAKAKEYAETLAIAKNVLDDADFIKLDSKNIMEIRKEVLKTHCKLDVEGKSEDYIIARFDAINDELSKTKEDDETLGKALSNVSINKKEDSNEALQEKRNDELYNNWNKKEEK